MNVEQARFNMVEQQVRPWDVLDPAVLDALMEIPRERFVPEKWKTMAFADLEVPLGHGQRMWPPRLEGRALQALELTKTDRVLEIGTGSGFLTACLARLAGSVSSVEINSELAETARRNLAAAGVENATVETGDGAQGRPGPWDAIVITGSVPAIPEEIKAQLAVGGRLFVVVGEALPQRATRVTQVAPGAFRTEVLVETGVPALANVRAAEKFEF